jgi:hypothetical protein
MFNWASAFARQLPGICVPTSKIEKLQQQQVFS